MTTLKADRLLGTTERRGFPCEEFELRATSDTTATLTGYASVFDKGYDIAGGPDRGGWTEFVDPRAFDETLKRSPDLYLLVDHEIMPMARTKAGNLDLRPDKVGLRVVAELDRRDPDVQKLEIKRSNGMYDEMSFAFRTVRHDFNDETSERRLLELNLDKGDVSVVRHGANPYTSVGIRSAVAAIAAGDMAELRSLDPDDVLAAHKILGQLLDPTPDDGDDVVEELSKKPGMSVAQARRLLQLTA